MVERVLTAEESRRRRRRMEAIRKTIAYIVLSIGSIIMIAPFLWMISTSLKDQDAVFTYPPEWIPWNQKLRKAGKDMLEVAGIPQLVEAARFGKPRFWKVLDKSVRSLSLLSSDLRPEDREIAQMVNRISARVRELKRVYYAERDMKIVADELERASEQLVGVENKIDTVLQGLEEKISIVTSVDLLIRGLQGKLRDLQAQWGGMTSSQIDDMISSLRSDLEILNSTEVVSFINSLGADGEKLKVNIQKALNIMESLKRGEFFSETYPEVFDAIASEVNRLSASFKSYYGKTYRVATDRRKSLNVLKVRIEDIRESFKEYAFYIKDINFVVSKLEDGMKRLERVKRKVAGSKYAILVDKVISDYANLIELIKREGDFTEPVIVQVRMIVKEMKKVADKLMHVPKIVWHNYVEVVKKIPFGRFYLNSLIVATSTTIGVLITSSMAAYSFARIDYPMRDTLFLAYLGTLMIPGQVTMIPVFILFKKFGLIDTLWALILPGMFTAYGTFLLRQFFLSIPRDLEEAAIIDGATRFRIYTTIILPLSKAALATLATFTFMWQWNDFMWPLIVINTQTKMTIPVGLAHFQGMYSTQWTLLMAGAVLATLPVIIVFIFNQRFFVRGIMLTGLKG